MVKAEFENTIIFAGRVVEPLTRPPDRPVNPADKWIRDWEITGLYLGTDRTLQEIGDHFQLTREGIRQIVTKNLISLYDLADEQTRAEFPWESLATRKPLSIPSRRNRSLAHGGRSVGVETLVRSGLSGLEIQRKLQITSQQLSQVRPRLRRWGVELPYEQEASSPEYKQNLGKLLTGTLPYSEAQKIIDQVTYGTYHRYSTGNKPNFISVAKLARQSGLFDTAKRASLLVKLLKNNQIPTGTIEISVSKKPGGEMFTRRYYFILSCYEESAKNIFQNYPELALFKDNPVSVIGKKSLDIPSTFQLQYSNSYKTIGRLLEELGYARFLQHAKLAIRALITPDCPVSVFAHRNHNFHYRVEDERSLRVFVLNRLTELKT